MKQAGKLLGFILLTILLIARTTNTVLAADTEEKTVTDNGNGTITITYDNAKNQKLKVGITKDKKTYYYDLADGKNQIDLPLNMGNGSYTIKLFQNISKTKYGAIFCTNIELELQDENLVYQQSNVIVNFTLTDKSIEKADSLVKDCTTPSQVASTIYDYIIKNFVYDPEKAKNVTVGYIPDIEIVYQNKKGICYDISAIMAAMMRSQGIEVKLVTGYTPNIPDAYHAWNSIYDTSKKSWYAVDGTYDIAMYQNGKKYSMKKSAKNYSEVKYEY